MKCIEDEIPFEVPEGWEWSRANCISDVRDGTHDTPAYVEKGVPLITSKNLTPAGVDYSNVKYISVEDATQINQRSGVDVGDILFAMIGTIGNPKLVTENTLISIKNVALFKFSYSSDLSHHYILRVLEYLQEQMKENPSGGLQPFVSLNRLRTTLLPIAPITEQNRIVEKLENLLRKVDLINYDCDELDTLIKAVKSKILDLAIRGQLVPQDPNDEPASVLLERIRAEKEELIKAGKIKRDKKESIIFRGEDNSYYEKIGNKSDNIDENIPFEIPVTWNWCRGYTCFAGMGSKKPTDKFFDYIDIDSIDNHNHKIKKPKHLPASDAPSRASRAVQTGSVLFSLVRPYLENIALIEEKNANSIASTGFYVCNSAGVLYSEYMFFLMISGYVVSGLNQFMKGDNSPSISKDNIESWLYPIPPYEEQKVICKKIKAIFSKIEAIEKSLS